jgi:hypothetical protein
MREITATEEASKQRQRVLRQQSVQEWLLPFQGFCRTAAWAVLRQVISENLWKKLGHCAKSRLPAPVSCVERLPENELAPVR